MTDVATPTEESRHHIPGSALRTSRPKPKRVPTRVSIIAPKGSTTDLPTARSGSAFRSPDLNVTSTPWAKKLILTLDGGGIRGYSSLIILRVLMREIASIEQTLEPSASSSAQTERIPRDQIPDDVYREGQYLPCHYFDYIAGTSVGGLIAIMLGMLGQNVDDCITEFHRQNKAIPLADDIPSVPAIDFPLIYRRSTWPTKRTRSFFDTFAKFSVTATAARTAATARTLTDASMVTAASTSGSSSQVSAASSEFRKDSYQCQTLAWCTEIEPKRSRRPYAFCTYKEEDTAEPEQLVLIPEVAKAITTPSSNSFKPFKLGSGHFVDGSKQIRDPTLEVLKEITALVDDKHPGDDNDGGANDRAPIDLLLSLGTDEHHAWFYEKLRGFITPPSTAATTKEKQAIFEEEGRSYQHYHRFEVPNIKLGRKKKYFLREIEEAAEKWLAGPGERREEMNEGGGGNGTKDEGPRLQIKRYAQMLVDRRRARAATPRWETFALGVRYVCFHEGCRRKNLAEGGGNNDNGIEMRVFEGRGDFFDHLDRRHELSRLAAKGLADVERELDRGRRFGCS